MVPRTAGEEALSLPWAQLISNLLNSFKHIFQQQKNRQTDKASGGTWVRHSQRVADAQTEGLAEAASSVNSLPRKGLSQIQGHQSLRSLWALWLLKQFFS